MRRALSLLIPLGPVVRLELPSWPGQKALAGRLPTSICPTAAPRCSGKPDQTRVGIGRQRSTRFRLAFVAVTKWREVRADMQVLVIRTIDIPVAILVLTGIGARLLVPLLCKPPPWPTTTHRAVVAMIRSQLIFMRRSFLRTRSPRCIPPRVSSNKAAVLEALNQLQTHPDVVLFTWGNRCRRGVLDLRVKWYTENIHTFYNIICFNAAVAHA